MLEQQELNKLIKLGISNIEKIDTMTINTISSKISNELEKTFNTYLIDTDNLFMKLSRLNMYFADFDEINIKAKYMPEYKAIFLKNGIDIQNLDSSIVHECLHFLQSEFDLNDKIIKMGILKFQKFKKEKNLALNEAATQYVASFTVGEKPSNVTYFDMNFSTPSPNYYPIETVILKQMMFFTGSYPLFHSTILGNNIFEETFKTITSEEVFNFISNELDLLISYQDTLGSLYQKRNINTLPQFIKNYINKRIEITKYNIQNTVLNIQDAIFRSGFNNLIKKIENKTDCENVKAQMESFSNLLIKKESDFSYSNYIEIAKNIIAEKEKQLELYNVVLNDNFLIPQSSNFPIKNNPILYVKNIFNKIKLFFEITFKQRLLNDEI